MGVLLLAERPHPGHLKTNSNQVDGASQDSTGRSRTRNRQSRSQGSSGPGGPRGLLPWGSGKEVTSPPPPYAQLKGSWSSMKNGKPLFHHVLQCVSCWKKELPDGDCRQGRRD